MEDPHRGDVSPPWRPLTITAKTGHLADRTESRAMEIGVYTFVENTPDPANGQTLQPAQRLRDLLEEVQLADQVGLDVFGIGEHHRPDFLASAPIVMLGAAAERSKRIKLSTAVTVL